MGKWQFSWGLRFLCLIHCTRYTTGAQLLSPLGQLLNKEWPFSLCKFILKWIYTLIFICQKNHTWGLTGAALDVARERTTKDSQELVQPWQALDRLPGHLQAGPAAGSWGHPGKDGLWEPAAQQGYGSPLLPCCDGAGLRGECKIGQLKTLSGHYCGADLNKQAEAYELFKRY